jgi:hypothetical protein
MNFIIQNFSLETVSFFERGETWKEKRDVKQYMTLLILPLFDLHAEQKTKKLCASDQQIGVSTLTKCKACLDVNNSEI